jgi:hypothetical protein
MAGFTIARPAAPNSRDQLVREARHTAASRPRSTQHVSAPCLRRPSRDLFLHRLVEVCGWAVVDLPVGAAAEDTVAEAA